ncbi:RHS repeat-associated core domain-containing protein [Streptomyces eurocidicus]|uniref:RHS repeat-associated protein n=1 Tax=Streptomyces eurocidicus TaxID=66423 RepID=A0A7W8BHT1_STREU|nr:RHS repeat-associated core domain-containing protein [Streptomyces eurocidicus]MBB5121784.1 RHS repeat-associated protein [Streptomyces eurocidicus]
MGKSLAADSLPVTLLTAPAEPREREQAPTASQTAGNAEIRVLDHTASERTGVDGLLFSITPQLPGTGFKPAPTATRVRVDYSAFAQAFGGAYAARLRLAELPSCALTTPHKAECRTSVPLETVNDTEEQTLTARIPLHAPAATVLAAAPVSSGEKGDYKASPLSPSSTWKTDLNTGAFGWSYPMQVPAVPGGLKPDIGLVYSSSAIDGRTGNTNNQSSWVGDGFDLWPGFIERSYKPCADDDVKHTDGNKPGDLCWAYENATLSFNGKSGELVPAGDNQWKLRNDDGTKISRLVGDEHDNGDNDNEYWRLTSPDGTRYYFGYHKLNGWAAGKDTTDSTWTVPVYGNNTGEPCHKDTFKDSWCQQAWRWNLDYAVDRHGNAVSYYYGKESNSYGRDLEAKDGTPYTRGGYLKRIEYGLKSSDLYAKALAKVDIGNAERCLPDDKQGLTCAADTIGTKKPYWYDTPWDLNCTAGTECDKGRLSPSFWTRKRLTDVTTRVLKSDGTYASVDSWKLSHRWGMADTDYQLLLDSVQHTGQSATPAITLPKTTFAYTQRPNRLDKTGDGQAPFIKERLSTVADETGGQTDVVYSAPACDGSRLPTPETNTTRCFPQFTSVAGGEDPTQQWFNKYVVESVTAADRTGGSPDQVTRYEYLGDAAWHFDDDDGLTKEKFKTWSAWRGYGHVRVQKGGQGAGGMKSQEDTYFLRGMDGDRKSRAGGTKTVLVPVNMDVAEAFVDHESTAGFTYLKESYSGPDGKVLSKSLTKPWHHETARKTRSWGTVTANFTGTESARTYTSLDDGAGTKWRNTATTTVHDTATGRARQVDDHGDTSTPDDDRCTRTTYADNTDANILNLPSRIETVATSCATATVDRAKAVISDVRTAYDGGTYGATPTKGEATSVATLNKHDGKHAAYLESAATFDAYGRALTATDLTAEVVFDTDGTQLSTTRRSDGRTTTTAYTPATGFATTITTTTPPAKADDATTAQVDKSIVDPLRGQPVTTVDTNNKRTDLSYDALGRSTKVWLPNRPKSGNGIPSLEFTYTLTDGKPVAVGTRTLNNKSGQLTSYTLYDGFLRPRQTQAPGPDRGRLLTDTFYDERGLATKTFTTYYANGTPAATLFAPDDARKVESQTWNTYDGLGRVTRTQQIAGNSDVGKVLNTTRTLYGGDRTTVIPPAGSTATTSVIDARGQTRELRQLHSHDPDADFDTTRYAYTPAGALAQVTDPAGNSWSYIYDQQGRRISADDPDQGTILSTYDDRGRLTSTTNARKTRNTLYYTYDDLGRRTEIREGSPTGVKLAEWTYDTVTNGKGRPATTTRYADGNAFTTRVDEYDSLYRATRTSVTIPAMSPDEKPLAGTYDFGTAYEASGAVQSIGLPPAGSLPGNVVSYTYDDILRPVGATTFDGIKATVSSYSLTGKPLQSQLNRNSGKATQVTNGYEWGTQRLATTRVDRQNAPAPDKAAAYTYDETGNIRALSDTAPDGTDTQCFTYDHLRRVTDEWTQSATACADAPAGNLIGGPAPYWNSYTYDKTGNRLTEERHDTGGDSAKDIKRTYTYPAAGKSQPHALTTVQAVGPTGTAKDSYTYDPTGNTIARALGGDTQSLDWDTEGHLAKVTEPKDDKNTKTASYIYDADGRRLIARTDTSTTLYLGTTEITLAKGSTTPKATRYLDFGNGLQAVQSDDGSASFVVADHLGTGQLAIDTITTTATRRRATPFGAPRGEQPKTWPGTKGFVGGTTDPTTGLTHLGAREYDPQTGRFISVDPLMDLADPQQNHGYTYANNNPATLSDPTGLMPGDCALIGVSCTRHVDGSWDVEPNDNYRGAPTENDIESEARVVKLRNYSQCGIGRCGYAGMPAPARQRHIETTYRAEPKWVQVVNTVVETVPKVVGPDVEAWEDCGNLEISGCAWAATDVLPWGKIGKIGKFLKDSRILEEAAEGSERVAKQCHSFLPGTEVLLADGTSKKIEEVETGDHVLATDPETGETTAREVVAGIVTEDDKDFTELTVETDEGGAALVATDTHPFWDTRENTWADAGQVRPGNRLRTADNGAVTVQSATHFRKRQRTHDLTVSGTHTYYVLAGTTPVLVHNCDVGSADLAHLTDRADDLHSLIPSGGQRYRTTGVLHADGIGGGIDLSAVGARSNLTLIQRADSLDAGELAISATNGAHAEVKLVTAAQHLGLRPGGIAASRPFCPACSQFLTGQGATLMSPRTALWLPPGVG